MDGIKWTALRHKMLREISDGAQFSWHRNFQNQKKSYSSREPGRSVAGAQSRTLRELDDSGFLGGVATGPSYFAYRDLHLTDTGRALLAEWNAAHPEGQKP